MLYNQKTKGIISMKNIQVFIIFLMLLTTFPNLQAQDFLQKAKNYLDAGECEKAQRAYDAYRVENPRNYDVEQRIEDCKTIKDKTFSVNGVSFKMIFVQGGTFQMGSYSGFDNEKPVHNVTLSDYYMGETEVTQALWKAVMGYDNNPSRWKGDQLPVESVYRTDCQEFVARLNSVLATQLQQGYRFALPSEAQWEYAARGGLQSSGGKYAGGDNVDTVAWYEENSSSRTHDVKQKASNELGLYDMSGNVLEWCEDWYSDYFYSDNRNWTDPVNTTKDLRRILRGGSWNGYASYCRVAIRISTSPSERGDAIGFRLALVRR